jgi:hypothetical protein
LARAPLPPGLSYAARIFGLFEMLHVLIAYPLLSVGGLAGTCWNVLYARPFWAGTGAIILIHAASLLWLRREVHAFARLASPPTETGSPQEEGEKNANGSESPAP